MQLYESLYVHGARSVLAGTRAGDHRFTQRLPRGLHRVLIDLPDDKLGRVLWLSHFSGKNRRKHTKIYWTTEEQLQWGLNQKTTTARLRSARMRRLKPDPAVYGYSPLERCARMLRDRDDEEAEVAELIVRYGQHFAPSLLPNIIQRGPLDTPFANAARLSRHSGLIYCEGFVDDWVHHAWCADEDGRVYDSTLSKLPVEYIGFAFTADWRSGKVDNFALLEQPHALHTIRQRPEAFALRGHDTAAKWSA